MELAQGILLGVGAYAAVGLVFALVFVLVGVGRVDAGAKGAGFLFRALILPASAALWPVMLVKWIRAKPEVHQ
jgi:hypothetical protein